jgi:hypothetical protein
VQHLKNIFDEGELNQNSVVNKFFTTAADSKKYKTNFYNLDATISVGYRVKSLLANHQIFQRHTEQAALCCHRHDRS